MAFLRWEGQVTNDLHKNHQTSHTAFYSRHEKLIFKQTQLQHESVLLLKRLL